ncbi:MAG: M48 family metalloprotease [Candidatus Omnitrophica bacterium]|nr:M48 family metalloprotease [Candidatus Omnitrophota bacterium]
MKSWLGFTLLVWALAAGSCAPNREEIVPVSSRELPAHLADDESEVRQVVSDFERYLSGREVFYRDAALETYLRKLTVPLASSLDWPESMKLRVKILRDPTVNAVSLMNGHLYVHTGILARLDSEAELAFVLAHELAHIDHRDTLYQMINLRRKTVTFKVLDLLFTPVASLVGAGGLSEMTLALIYASSVTGYGREAEAGADLFAIEKISRLGYPAQAALRFFEVLMAEKERYKEGHEIFFLSSHPSNRRRKAELTEWIRAHPGQRSSARRGRYLRATYAVRLENAKLNLDLGRFYHALDDVAKLLRQNPEDPAAYYVRAEIYRNLPANWEKVREEVSEERWKRLEALGQAGRAERWREKALRDYRKSLQLEPGYAPPYRGLGVLFLELENFPEAKRYFNKYLEIDPAARDRRSVLRHLKDMEAMMQGGKA